MDWDLQAIVRGCSGEAPPTFTDGSNPYFNDYSAELDDLLLGFPDISGTTMVLDELQEPGTTMVLDELQELYKPFYPALHPFSTQTVVASSVSTPQQEIIVNSSVTIPLEVKASGKAQDLQDLAGAKCRKSKKNQTKRVVKQVTADGLMDSWAWRKYGQKPIKGSPYPRSYYRCSSFKGCSARKQVERSHLNPGVFIVTYTEEHGHPHPTRRNSLAGSIRKITKLTIKPECTEEACSSKSTAVEDELMPSVQSDEGSRKEEDQQLKALLEDDGGSEAVNMADTPPGDEWLPSLEELKGLNFQDDCFMDKLSDTIAESWFFSKSNVVSGG